MNQNPIHSSKVPASGSDTPVHLQPNVWHDLYSRGKVHKYSFFVELMSCMQASEPGIVLKHLPANLIDDFKDTLSRWAETEQEEDFVIVGSEQAPWGLKDVWRVIRWLDQNPEPELGPPVEDPR